MISLIAKKAGIIFSSNGFWIWILIFCGYIYFFDHEEYISLFSNILVVNGVFLGAAVTGLTIIGGVLCQENYKQAVIENDKKHQIYEVFLEDMKSDYAFIGMAFVVSLVVFLLSHASSGAVRNPIIAMPKNKILLFIDLVAIRFAFCAVKEIVFSFLLIAQIYAGFQGKNRSENSHNS